MSVAYEQLALSALEQIAPPRARPTRSTRPAGRAAEEWSYSHFLRRLLEAELVARRRRAPVYAASGPQFRLALRSTSKSLNRRIVF